MIKRVNFTGRRRIPRRHVQVEIHDGKPPTFNAIVDLDGTQMPAGAKVFLESMCPGSNVVKRFDFGAVGAIVPEKYRSLADFDLDHVFFVLKVIDQTERIGRILGIAENIRPERAGKHEKEKTKAILPIIESDGLGQQLWDLDFGEHHVCLRVNKDVPGMKDRARWDPLFYAVVYPSVVREVLTKAIDRGAEIDEQSDHWAVMWLRFGRDLHPEKEIPPKRDEEENRDEWIEAVVEAFCLRHSLKDVFLSRIPQETGGDQ